LFYDPTNIFFNKKKYYNANISIIIFFKYRIKLKDCSGKLYLKRLRNYIGIVFRKTNLLKMN